MHMTARLKNKVAIVTGAASGIGSATIKKFLDEGATVLATDINEAGLDQLLEAEKPRLNTFPGNITKQEGKVPLGSSGIQVAFKTDQIIEAIRPGRVVKIRPDSWPKSQIPREEYLFNNSPENRFPTPAIFPKY
jgi:NAD(P)-dependent dehydrogenase (short-subunit alcohol dehydrogenase family)